MDERTIKKYWEYLEQCRCLKYNLIGEVEDENLTFNERWKRRRKNPNVYYHIEWNDSELFRKIPRDTLTGLNETYKVSELTLKIYITLINYQEICYVNKRETKTFSYADLANVLNYKLENQIRRRMEKSLLELVSLGLVNMETGSYTMNNGWKVPVFLLKQVNWYIDFSFKDFKADESTWSKDLLDEVKQKNKEMYSEYFS